MTDSAKITLVPYTMSEQYVVSVELVGLGMGSSLWLVGGRHWIQLLHDYPPDVMG